MTKAPWETIDEFSGDPPADASKAAGPPASTPSTTSTGPPPSGDAWMVGAGFDVDMSGDKNPNEGASLRFWIPKGEERTIIFVTDAATAPVIWEHSGQVNGNYRNFASCLQPLGVPCDLCKHANVTGTWRRYKGRFFTVIDMQPFKDRAGRERKNERRLLVAKKETSEILRRKYQARIDAGDRFSGAMYKVFRPNTDKSCAVGEDYEFVRMVNLADYGWSDDGNKDFIRADGEIDYARILKPDPEKVKIFVDRLASESGRSSESGSSGMEGPGSHSVAY